MNRAWKNRQRKWTTAILDVIMPKLGGPGAATRLSARFPEMRVLLTSDIPQSEVIAKRRYLQEPYSPTILARLARRILDEPPVARPAPDMA
jgi:hypothetical protein